MVKDKDDDGQQIALLALDSKEIKKEEKPTSEARKTCLTDLRKAALIVTYVSVVATIILGGATFVVAILENSAACYGFAIDSLLDCALSCVVIWRYHAKDSLDSDKKERRACLSLAILFLLSFVTTFAKSLHDLLLGELPSKSPVLWIIAVTNSVICLCLAAAKFWIGHKMKSKPVISDGLSTFIGFVLALGIVIETKIYDENTKVWYLDSTFGIICSVVLLAYSIKLFFDAHQMWKNSKQTETVDSDKSALINSALEYQSLDKME